VRPIASVSLDLDNEWSYHMVRGLPGWQERPSYLPLVVPRVLDELERAGLEITFFVVGIDAVGADRPLIRALADAGHEIGNHSFEHRPWMNRDPIEAVDAELARAEDALGEATSERPRGYRGPGYSLSAELLEILVARGYDYDASTLPTWIGPFARAAYFRAAEMDDEQRRARADLFGHLRDARHPLRPYRWDVKGQPLLEIPVTTVPLLRVPMHMSYLLWLAGISPHLARAYLSTAIALCRAQGLNPSMLLHPLDFLDATEVPSLAFFPAMNMASPRKIVLVREFLERLGEHFNLVSMARHAAGVSRTPERRATSV